MFILILFGYKQYKVFTTDVLGYTLIDCIWVTAMKEINKVNWAVMTELRFEGGAAHQRAQILHHENPPE